MTTSLSRRYIIGTIAEPEAAKSIFRGTSQPLNPFFVILICPQLRMLVITPGPSRASDRFRLLEARHLLRQRFGDQLASPPGRHQGPQLLEQLLGQDDI